MDSGKLLEHDMSIWAHL